MKHTLRTRMLSIYDLLLATGAIWIGTQMVMSRSGTIFAEEYPDSWASRLPFDSWMMPGILAIVIFGLGNIIAAVCSYKNNHKNSWVASAIMGTVFFFGLIFQRIILEESYIVTNPFLALSVIQLCLSGYVFLGYKKARFM
ncbi:hypothetical protein [Sporosarcina obsidiansis]|uniref:hypothetical protein n=1 Tax=Sporosarcina obsidiansis TaxID=2660748 RepID=UPI001E5771BA|nr:hypothetical protein [Sporosarcina obsidiansis]